MKNTLVHELKHLQQFPTRAEACTRDRGFLAKMLLFTGQKGTKKQ